MSDRSVLRVLLDHLTGWPMTTISYRMHQRILDFTHPLICWLIEDSADGQARRASLIDWHRAERPVVDVLGGTASYYRIDGPRQLVEGEVFALGSLIQSPGVTAHLDPIETLQLELRMRGAIEAEILRWIAEHKLQERPPVEATVNRAVEDPKALARITQWMRRTRWVEEQSYVH
jgi:hypothetical protein